MRIFLIGAILIAVYTIMFPSPDKPSVYEPKQDGQFTKEEEALLIKMMVERDVKIRNGTYRIGIDP